MSEERGNVAHQHEFTVQVSASGTPVYVWCVRCDTKWYMLEDEKKRITIVDKQLPGQTTVDDFIPPAS